MATAPGPSWWVVSNRQTQGQSRTGQFVNGVEVTFSTAAGNTGTVFLADTDYSADNVAAAVAAKAALMDGVLQLKG